MTDFRRFVRMSGQAIHDPRALPELRADLRSLAVEGGAWEEAERWRHLNEMAGVFNGTSLANSVAPLPGEPEATIVGPVGYGPEQIHEAMNATEQRTASSMGWARSTLDQAQLMWMSDEMCDVLFSSFDTIPEDTLMDEYLPPSPRGLIVFERPFLGIDSGSEFDEVRVDAVMWGPVMLPAKDDPILGTEGLVPGFALASFRFLDPTNQDDASVKALHVRAAELHEEHIGLVSTWLPLGRADWCLGDPITATTHDLINADSDAHRSMVEDRKLMAALWSLIRQKRVVEQSILPPSRVIRRRMARRHQEAAPVTVVHLRRPEYRPRNDDGSTGRHVGVRFVVRSHWRNQAWGPGRSRRRLILVPPHIKGPEGAPMKHTERVWSIDQ